MTGLERPDDRKRETPALGDRVRISSGQLAGLIGVVKQITEGGKYALVIEGLAEGVMVVVSATALVKCG